MFNDDSGTFPEESMRPGKDMSGAEGFKPGRDMMPDLQKNEANAEDASYVTGAINMMDMGSAEYSVVINGGSITVDASGDGIDSNGSIIINGGNTVVYGPINSGNAALDYGTELLFNGGNIIALGNGGMQEGISSKSSQDYLYYGVNTYGSDDLIEVYSGENLLLSTVSRKTFNLVIVSFEGLNNGDSLTVKIGNDSYEFTAGQNSSMGSFGGGKGFKG